MKENQSFGLEKFEYLIRRIEYEFSKIELESSVTFSLMKYNFNIFSDLFDFLEKNILNKDKMIDLGCGYGFLAHLFGSILNFKKIYGVDIDITRLNKAKKYIKTIKLDLEKEKLPFPKNYLDFAISFGVLDHMCYWDNFFEECYRVLKKNGLLLISLTNLGSWDTRFSLLFGFQPRHVEISKKAVVGINKYYLVKSNVGHIHTCTLRALVELGEYYNFNVIKKYGLKMPYPNPFVRIVDKILSRLPQLSTRYLVLFRKE